MTTVETDETRNAPAAATDGEARLSLGPAPLWPGSVSGAWWPRSRDASAELPGLAGAVTSAAGHVSRVAVQADAFGNIPHRVNLGGRKVPVAWFRSMNRDTVSLTMAGRDDLVLLVVPPQASAASAQRALETAAAGSGTGDARAMLTAAGAEEGPAAAT